MATAWTTSPCISSRSPPRVSSPRPGLIEARADPKHSSLNHAFGFPAQREHKDEQVSWRSQHMRFSIYRYDPDRDAKPYMKDYDVALEDTDRMLLDALIRIKATDDSLALRRSCREGVCGSDAMNINGSNGLACITRLVDLKQPVVLMPLPGLPVIRDLIVDMTQFFKQYQSIKPYLQNEEAAPE